MSTAKDRDRFFISGVALLIFGLALLFVMFYAPESWGLTRQGFPWMLRAAVLSDLVGTAFILASGARLWIRISLAAVGFAGSIAWFLAAFAMM
jgi:hypothetical protein